MRRVIYNWEEVLEQHRLSGKSIPEFCSEIGIHPNTFYKHRKRIDRNYEVVEIKPILLAPTEPIVLKTEKFTISLSAGFDEVCLKSVLKVIGEFE